MYKKCKVILLPQSRKEGWKAGDIIKTVSLQEMDTDTIGYLRLASFSTDKGGYTYNQPQHLYLISDDEIKELP